MKTVVFGGSNSGDLARKVARKMGASYSALKTKQFPDGETYVRVPLLVKGKRVVLIQSMYPDANNAMMEAIFAINTSKELGAKKVVLVAPYLCYMRQDKRFLSGECISQHIMADLLSCADLVMAIDPHLHRISSLNKIFKTKTKKLSANRVLADWIGKHHKNTLIIGPDIESYQWAETIAQYLDHHAIILRKKRYTARSVRIKVHRDVEFKGREVVIVDDIISTGHTMIEPIKQLKKRGAKRIYCVGVHGLFVEGALQKLKKLGARVLSTNTLGNPVNKIDVSEIIAKAL